MTSNDKIGDTNSRTNQIHQNPAVRQNIHEISQALRTGLSPEALDICIKLCEAGAHPTALADAVNQIRKCFANSEGSEES